MLHVLLETTPARPRRVQWAIASVLVHTTLIGGAVVVTTRHASPAPLHHETFTRVYYQPPKPPEARAATKTPATKSPARREAQPMKTLTTAKVERMIKVKVPTMPVFDPSAPFNREALSRKELLTGT